MLSTQEDDFVRYWQANRLRQKNAVWQRGVGMPLLIVLVIALLVNVASGWYKRADAVLRSHSSLLITILIGLLAVVIFVAVFSVRHRWEQNEQRYQELLAKKEGANTDAALPS